MPTPSLAATAAAMVVPGKGLLAADESFPTIKKRFEALKIPDSEENRRAYRQMLFTAPDLEKSISGVILFDETLRQKNDAGKLFPQLLAERGIIPGIKVDKGAIALPGFPEEKFTEGLDELGTRLAEYAKLGARFAKWRAVLVIGAGTPSLTAIRTNATALALYARLCQQAGLVPIVEPEVLMDGDHTLAECEAAIELTLREVFATLGAHRVNLEEMILKTGMVVAGAKSQQQPSVEDVAQATVRCLRRVVPAALPGIVFLSGGQSPEDATARLAAINRIANLPWPVTFSYGRALQDEPMEKWAGQPGNVAVAQQALQGVASRNGQAAQPSRAT